jgi:amino acid transporter
VLVGGIASGVLYIGATLTLLLAVPKDSIGVLQGVVEAIQSMANAVGVPWIVTPLAAVLTVSIAGIASAWLSGSARIPFVAGIDRYLPSALGRLHPRTATPYVALIVHGVFSALFMAFNNLVGKPSVKEAFQILLALAVVLQLVPFLYVYAALIRIAQQPRDNAGRYGKAVLMLAGLSGLITTAIGMIVAFVPPAGVKSVPIFELKMTVGTVFFLALAGFFFFVYSRRKQAAPVAVSA